MPRAASLILRKPTEHADPSAHCREREGVQRPQRGGSPILGGEAFHREHRQRDNGSQQQGASGAGDHREIQRRDRGNACCVAAYTLMGLALVAGGVGLQWLGIALCVAVGVFTIGAVVMGRL
jgi:hypothetical protein